MAGPRTSKPAFDAASGDPDRTRFPALAGLVVESAQKGHVLLGEPHEDGMVAQTYAFLAANPGMFRQAAQNGVKNLVLEFPHELQGKIDSWLEGKTDKGVLKIDLLNNFTSGGEGNNRRLFMENFLQTVDNANDAGMKIMFADKTAGEFFSLMQRDKAGRLSKEDGIKAQWDRYDDAEQFDLLRQTIPPTEKIMAVVGVRHIDSPEVPLDKSDPRYGENPKGLADRLREEGGHPVTTIGLWNNDRQENTLSNGPPEKMGYITKVGGTDYSAFFDEGKVLGNAPRPAEPKTWLSYTPPGFNG